MTIYQNRLPAVFPHKISYLTDEAATTLTAALIKNGSSFAITMDDPITLWLSYTSSEFLKANHQEDIRAAERWGEHKRVAERSSIPDRDGYESAAQYSREARSDGYPQQGDRVELLADWTGFTTPYLRKGHKGTVALRGPGSTGVMVVMDEDPDKVPWAMSLLDVRTVQE